MFYRATLVDGRFGAGEESLESRLFAIEDIPWDELSFPTVRKTLELFLEDLKTDNFQVHLKDIRPPTASIRSGDQNASMRNTS